LGRANPPVLNPTADEAKVTRRREGRSDESVTIRGRVWKSGDEGADEGADEGVTEF